MIPIAVVALAVLLSGPQAVAKESPVESAVAPLPAEWIEALKAYAIDPVRNRRALRRLGRGGTDGLPPIAVLALADARLRSGNRPAARRLFDQVAAGDEGSPWTAWGRLGLGWVAILDGDPAVARGHFDAVAGGTSPARAMATLITALLDVELERTPAALETLDRLTEDPDASLPIRQAAALGAGYVRYWGGDFAAAAVVFERAATIVPGSPLWDDARHGAAMARWQAGERERALEELRALGRMESLGAPDEGAMRPVVDLERGGAMRAGVARYRKLPFRMPDEQVAALLDRNGPALARAALRRFGEDVPPPLGGGERRARRRRPAQAVAPEAVRVASPPAIARPSGGGGRVPWIPAAIAGLIALAAIASVRALGSASRSHRRR